jgi:ABC-type transport system involved in multi-copper enzyme maturation permease subunit
MRLSLLETLRRKELYVVLVLVFLLAAWMQIANPGASGAGRFAKDVVMQVIWLASFALAAPLATRQVASDMEQKTIYVLMSRPIHRWHYIFGRAAGAAIASVVCFTSMFIVLIAMLTLKGVVGISDLSLWQAYALQVIALFMLCSIAVFFATSGSPSGAVTFSFIVLAVMRYGGTAMMQKIAAMEGFGRGIVWAAYMALPHFEFFNISQRTVHGWGPLPTPLFFQVMLYGLAYSVFAAAFAAYLFRKRWL